MLMEMLSSKVELYSFRTSNRVLIQPHEKCTRRENKLYLDDNGFPECSSSSSVSDHRLSKTEDSVSSSSSLGSDPDSTHSGQPTNPSRNETMAASSLVQIWEARTTQQPPPLIESRTSSMGSNASEDSESVKESEKLIQLLEEGNNEKKEEEEIEFVLQPSESGEKDRKGVRVMDIIRKLSNDSETMSNGSSSSNDNSKEVQTTEAKCFPRVACHPRIRGRQAFADLMVQMMRDREKELTCLLESHCVSNFTHGGRIQSMLRFRCYKRCMAIQDRNRCKLSSVRSDLNRSSGDSDVTHLLREKYKANSEKFETGTVSSSRTMILGKDPHKTREKKVLQEKFENSDLKKAKEISSFENVKNGLRRFVGETIQWKTTEGRDNKREYQEKDVAKESPEGEGERRELATEKAIAKESPEGRGQRQELPKEKAVAKEFVEGKALSGIAEKVNMWNYSEEKMNERKGMEEVKFEGKANTERVEKTDVLEEATRRIINLEIAERSITTTSKEKMMRRFVFAEKVVRRKEESNSKEIEDRNIKLPEVTRQEGNCMRKPGSEERALQELTMNSDVKKPIENESREGGNEMRQMEVSIEGNALMGIAEKVNLWNSKEEKNKSRAIEKGKGKTETNEVLQEASRRISNVETAERSIATSRQTVEKVSGSRDVMDRRESSGEATRHESAEKGRIKKEEDFAFVAKSEEIVEDRNMNQEVVCHGSREKNKEKNSSQHGEETTILRKPEAKSTKDIKRNISQEVTNEGDSISEGSRERAKVKNSSQEDEEKSIVQHPNVENGIKESEDEEEKGENIEESTVEFECDWDDNEMVVVEEEEDYGDYDLYIGENMNDWVNDISRPRSYWEDLRKERYLEVLNTESEKKDICNLIERRTVSNFLKGDFRQKIDNLMITRLQRRIGLPINHVEEEEDDDDDDDEEEWEEPEKTSLDVYSQSSARSSTMMSWNFTEQDIDKDQDPTRTLSRHESSSPTNQSIEETQTIRELRSQVERLQEEVVELRSTVKYCIDMQFNFQKSITQDLSRKCCVCSEMPVDSFLYRYVRLLYRDFKV